MVREYTDYYFSLWERCKTEKPVLGEIYSKKEQSEREKILEHAIHLMKENNQSKQPDRNSKSQFLHTVFSDIFEFDRKELDLIISTGYKNATKDFIQRCRKFDPGLTWTDIFQACRNAWIMFGIQIMLDLPVRLTSSVFSYSLLYPYTDNYLDDPEISSEIKTSFIGRFTNRLKGFKVDPFNQTEKLIFSLVGKIEGEYDRNLYPEVYESLLAIHSAQVKSIKLLRGKNLNGLAQSEKVKICIEKGGASVLADGYLINGKLKPHQEKFLFGYGVYLQFVDDIQDVNEDTCSGMHTIFSQLPGQHILDEYVNKTFFFGNYVINSLNDFNGTDLSVMQALLKKSIDYMLLETILLNKDFFSSPYIQEMEKYSPLSIPYLQKRRSRMSSQRISLIEKIIENVSVP